MRLLENGAIRFEIRAALDMRDDYFIRVNLATGLCDGINIEVVSGLSAGDRIQDVSAIN